MEESFVNRTNAVLEGVFYFPLPQDASISGFGMWIGDQLVEADVVEKQRAREIYETILREKRDPGLLEWSGGNIFKARVFPIPARGEKRIKISYTQVLPLQGNLYRYSYGLQSELLKQHPLRDLKIDLKVNSAVPLKSVSSPTHPARIDKTEHSGHIEFSAQEYAPTRDFEAVIEVESRQSDVIVIPHRRGDDGYFMVQLTPPGSSGDWERPLIPNGEPLRLLLLADTSASMDQAQRATQNAVLSSLLSSLTPKDFVNVAACDVNCDWIFEKPVAATSANIATIREVLAKRTSLGWTDLDKAFASAMTMSDPGTHVIYIGDGIVTTGNADPVAFAKRLHRLYEGKAGTFHAVTVGSSYESVVLKAIASLGGGSVRRVTGEQGPQAIALSLLNEIATPSLRNLKVEFKGLRTARVYPEELPNVAAGSQQILLGRYLPEGKDQTGEIVVTGTLGNKEVRFTSKVTLKDAEAGNSFIPRLWARMHLDKLLEQGTSDVVKQDIIALSEEYKIITPYTSFLVLESDADRERFAVKRRFQMRDAEKYFADGRDNASFELKQKQMKQAGDYRTALRRMVIEQLTGLGRDARMFQFRGRSSGGRGSSALGRDGVEFFWSESGPEDFSRLGLQDSSEADFKGRSIGGMAGVTSGLDEFPISGKKLGELGDLTGERGIDGQYEHLKSEIDVALAPELPAFPNSAASTPMSLDFLERGRTFGRQPLGSDWGSFDGDEAALLEDRPPDYRGEYSRRSPYSNTRSRSSSLQWIGPLFPSLSPPAKQPKEPKSTWPDPALALSRSLLRGEKLTQQKGGVILVRQSDTFDGRRNELASRNKRLELVSPTAWLGRTMPEGGPITVSWCNAKEFGSYNTAFLLGRVRESNKFDLQQLPLELVDGSLTPLHIAHAGNTATIEAINKDRALLILQYRDRSDYEIRFLIDVNRHVLLNIEYRFMNKVTNTTKFDDFVEVAGSWWAQRIETLGDKGQRLTLTTQTISEVPAEEFAKRMTQELTGKNKVLFLSQPQPRLADAKAAALAGKATFDQRALLTLHFAATQQWARALEHLQECERLSAGKQGMRWLRYTFLFASRRHEELRKLLLAEAVALAETNDPDARANDYFLAKYLFNQAGQTLETNEKLTLSDSLEKIYSRQSAHLQAMKTWRSQRVSLLQQAGQSDKVLLLSKALAVDYPRDYYLQYQYAQNLANSGDYAAAYAWLDHVLAPEAKWEPSEEESLRNQFTGFLQQQGRYREMADYLAAWIKRSPETTQPYTQYLSALVRSNQDSQAETLVAQWLREAQVKEELPGPAFARLSAAIAFATGRGYNMYTNRVEERWHAPLAQAALFFARHDKQSSTVSDILQSSFRSTDAAQEVRKTLAGILLKESDKLSAQQVVYFVDWVWNDAGLENDTWKTIADDIRKRWNTEKKLDIKNQLSAPLVRILTRLGSEELLSFLRIQWKEGPETIRTQYANELFDALLAQKWSVEIEDEAFSLLDKLTESEEPALALFSRVAALYRLTDAMIQARTNTQMQTIEHPEKLARVDLQKKQDENRKLAREGFTDRLRKEAAKHAKPFASWLTTERLWIDVLLERDLKQVADACWEILATAPVQVKPEDDGSVVEKVLDSVLRHRALLTLTHLAARKGADAAMVERLLKHVDGQMKDHPDDSSWRGEKYQLLVALDRPKDLEKELNQWVAGPDPENRWRLALGYLLAEQGRVAEAIKLFEAVEASDELSPKEYHNLADWYLVENHREQHEKARAAIYKTTGEYYLSQRIEMYLRPWYANEGHLPTQLDKELLQIFMALFEKSSSPQNYLWSLQRFYQASRDFRLLSMLADGVIGHSAGKVYPFLQGMSAVLGEVRDEATVDELVAQIVKVRPSAKTTIDQRALDMLELLVERRAAELQNQPGPHADKALIALERAFKHEWSPGEPRLMADFLGSLGNIPQPAISKVQLHQLEVMHREAAMGSFDRLHIALRLAETVHRYSRQAEAMDLLQAALKEFEDANGGILPTSAKDALTTLIAFTESTRQYERGEKLLLAQLKHPIHTDQKNWLIERINELYRGALENHGDVTLGKGAVLYKALEQKLFVDLTATDQNHRYQLLSQVIRMYRTAYDLKGDRKIVGVVEDLKTFAFKRLPPILKEQSNNYEQIVNDVANTLKDLAGPRDGIAFLLDRIDDEPGWLRYTNQDAWSQYCNRLGEWRMEVKELGDLEPRLLKFVLIELRRDLRLRETRNRTLYRRDYNYYWSQKEGDFAKVAEEILAERKQSSASVEHIADYLFWGLSHKTRAIEILFEAHRQKILAESGQWQLADCLHRTSRYAESIPLLLPLIKLRPENLSYRTKLMHAYFHTEKQAELLALLKQTDGFFHEKDRWNEDAMSGLAYSCLENHLYTQSVAYYEELIPLHQRSHPHRGIGDGFLSSYYAGESEAYAGLGKTKEAVDKASGAVVSWGPHHQQRKDALEALIKILVAAPDLAGYVAELDKEKLQSAIVRKAIGQAYVRKNDHARAIPQFQLAAELQPNDTEIYEALIACYDKIGDKEGAVRQLLQAVELSRRDIKLYEQLGQRLGGLKQPIESERAYTSMVEMLPNESESHALLAEIREKQNRWRDAIVHWERVAQIRSLEPTGLLKLAAAQIHEKAWDSTKESLRRLRSQSWPQRFGDVQQQARDLEKKLEERSKN
ncbi:MAG TPA: VIT domain-containing protein [Gemmata sp.]|nr:VIT domain-containing protein [Gemmata sp.]